jgi:hypothetical protein
MNTQLSFQERCEAFAAWHGRFVDMHKNDNSSTSCIYGDNVVCLPTLMAKDNEE